MIREQTWKHNLWQFPVGHAVVATDQELSTNNGPQAKIPATTTPPLPPASGTEKVPSKLNFKDFFGQHIVKFFTKTDPKLMK